MIKELFLIIHLSDKQEPRNLPPDGTTFNQISLGKRLEQTLPAYGYWNVQFYQMEPGYVNFEIALPRGSSLGFYARRNALPTHTNYDLMKIVKGRKEPESKQSQLAFLFFLKQLEIYNESRKHLCLILFVNQQSIINKKTS